MRRLIQVLLLFGGCFLGLLQPAMAEKRVALVVGNSTYKHIPSLANPVNDAKLVADTLRGLGFTLVGGMAQLDLDDSRFRQAVRDFGAELQGVEVALFYYAGHGVQVRGSNYLVPIGANPTREADVDFQMLDANLVLRQMEGSGSRLNLVILDACRNNPFGGRGLRSATSGLAQMQAPEGTLISFATQPGNVALDGTDLNSPFTKALAETIRRPGLDIFRTFNEIGLAVTSATGGAQQPWVSMSPIKGDFYFAAATAQGSEQSPATERAPTSSPGLSVSALVQSAIKSLWGSGSAGSKPASGRLALVLVADGAAKAVGPPLHTLVDLNATYNMERDLTLPGDIERIAVTADATTGQPGMLIDLSEAAVERINRGEDFVGRQVALVLDGRTVLGVASLGEPLSKRIALTGRLSLTDLERMMQAIAE